MTDNIEVLLALKSGESDSKVLAKAGNVKITVTGSSSTNIDNIILRHLVRKDNKHSKGAVNLAVYVFLKSFANVQIPIVETSEWAKYAGLTTENFLTAINELIEYGLLKITITTFNIENTEGKIKQKECITEYVLCCPDISFVDTAAIEKTSLYQIDDTVLKENKNQEMTSQKATTAQDRKNKRDKEIIEKYGDLAEMLFRSISSYRKITDKSINSEWCTPFKKLIEDGDTSKEEVIEVLKWYDANIGGEYVPVAYSAKSFLEKYSRIKDAMNRDSFKKTSRRIVPDMRLFEKDKDYSKAEEKATVIDNTKK